MPRFFDPHVCHPPHTYGMPEWLQKTWRCPRCVRRWHLERFRSEDGERYLGCSWILEFSYSSGSQVSMLRAPLRDMDRAR